MVLDVTAKTEEGNEIFRDYRIYMPQASTSRDNRMVFGAHLKAGFVRDTSIQPFKPKTETFEIPVPEGVRNADVTVALSYEYVPDNSIPIHTVTRKVSLDR